MDLILTNGRIHTMDDARPVATALAVRMGRIAAVGADDDILALRDGRTEWIDLAGRCVTPGLVDAHVHFHGLALSLQNADLDGARSLDEALERIRLFAAGEPGRGDGAWLLGRGWSQDAWPTRAFPTAAQLDAIVAGRPVFLSHKSGHAAWVNTRALRLFGIDKMTPDPPGGQIQRDSEGQPTGILFEEAIALVADRIPRPSEVELLVAMRRAQLHCWERGLTGMHDFDGRDCFRALQALHLAGDLGLRFVKNIPVYRLDHALGVGLRTGFGDDWLRIGGVKIFADGALGSRTAAMIAPYEGEPDNYGIVVTDKEDMLEKASAASAGGLSVTVHAIGDRANHDVLDVYAAVRDEEAKAGRARLRHRLEHVQVLHPTDVRRLAQLDVIASMQPIHATSDMEMADRYWGERARLSYAWRAVLDSGAALVFGSDAPVETVDPIAGIHAAVTRRRADGAPGPDGWYPEERLTASEALRAYTWAAAYTSGRLADLGSITAGKLADLTVIDRDLLGVAGDEIRDLQVAATIAGGEFRYRNL